MSARWEDAAMPELRFEVSNCRYSLESSKFCRSSSTNFDFECATTNLCWSPQLPHPHSTVLEGIQWVQTHSWQKERALSGFQICWSSPPSIQPSSPSSSPPAPLLLLSAPYCAGPMGKLTLWRPTSAIPNERRIYMIFLPPALGFVLPQKQPTKNVVTFPTIRTRKHFAKHAERLVDQNVLLIIENGYNGRKEENLYRQLAIWLDKTYNTEHMQMHIDSRFLMFLWKWTNSTQCPIASFLFSQTIYSLASIQTLTEEEKLQPLPNATRDMSISSVI